VRWKGPSKRRRTGQARELLAAAGGAFDRSLDPRQTMRAIARVAVPGLAELCMIELLGDDGTVGESVVVGEHERSVAQFEALRASHPPDLDGEHPLGRAISSREPVVVDDLIGSGALTGSAPSPESRELIASSGYSSAMVMPLLSRGRVLGALWLFYAREVPRHDVEDSTLMRALADRAATALDNSNMYAARTHLARTLQSSLLPDALPVFEKLALSSAYHPAGEGNEVGGDFYDVFATPLGCWLVVGDVCGKGPEAAAVTALVRHSIRAFAFVRSSPAQVLGAVNEVMLGHALSLRFATVVVARIDLTIEPAKVVVAGAGHPPPLVLTADGSAECPSVGGTMLGVRPGSNALDVQLELEPGSTMVLYTDGLLDAGAPRRGLTSQELCEMLANHVGAAPDLIVQQLERLALSKGAGRLRDDVAIVAARVNH
jgi:serine phosphatase RsbU (regulator of sigma subunit)